MKLIRKVKDKIHFKKRQIIYTVVFSGLIVFFLISCSGLPKSIIEYVSSTLTTIANENNNELIVHFSKNIESESSKMADQISGFNSFNTQNYDLNNYRKYVCGNVNNERTVSYVSNLNNISPAIFMTSWSTYYTDGETNINRLMAGIAVEGHNAGPVESRYNFCYITDKQADYIIENSNGLYKTHSDLINTEIELSTNYVKTGKQEIKNFYIRDIIVSNYGDVESLNNSFGDFIIAYYLPFAKLIDFTFAYKLGNDSIKNTNIIEEIKSTYPLDQFSCKCLGKDLRKDQLDIFDYALAELYKCQQMNDYTILYVILLLVTASCFSFTLFIFVDTHKECRLSQLLLCGLSFILIYTLFQILSICKIQFFVQCFTSTGLLLCVTLMILVIMVYLISCMDESNFKQKK